MTLQRHERERERRRLPMAERLEPRVLYSADALGGLEPLPDLAADDELAEARAALLARADLDARMEAERFAGIEPLPDAGLDARRDDGRASVGRSDEPSGGAVDDAPLATPVAAVESESIGTAHVVFVDAAVPDAAALGAALAETGASVVTIAADADGLLVVSRTLAEHDSLAAVHIVSHGEPGSLALGTATLDEAALAANGAGIARWGEALRAGGDVLVYGCDVGAGEIGERFVNALAETTGADVAASDDPTGHATLGGDWALERTSGAIESKGVGDAFAAANWRHLLDTITIAFQGDGLNVAANTTMAELDALQDGGQDVTLREAVRAAALDPGADTIVLGAGTWTLDISGDGDDLNTSGDLDVLEALTVRGAGSGDTTIEMSAADKDRLFDVHSGRSLMLEGLTVRGGEASDDGGAIRVLAGGTLIARDVVIEDSESLNERGGGIYNAGDTTLEEVTVRNNTAAKHGGGIFSDSGAQLALAAVSIIGNEATNEGGGGIEVKRSFTATDLVMRDNVAAKNGGALHAHDGATITGGSFTNNHSDGKGGAIEIHGALRLSDAQLSDNSAAKEGGALSLGAGGVLERVTISNNASDDMGGGVSHDGGSEALTLTGVTFTDNLSAKGGGALHAKGDVHVVNSTFVNNQDANKAGAIYEQGSHEARVSNSVFQDNRSGGSADSVDGNLVSEGFNVFSDDPGGSAVDGATDRVNTDARLLPLADNGGAVQTHAMEAGSPLINAGGASAPTTDASGQPVDAVPDIGAYESRTAADVVWLIDESGKLLRASGDLSQLQVLRDDLDRAENIVVDRAGKRLYWTEEDGNRFVVADLDGTELQRIPIVADPVASIALDTVNGYVLVANAGATPRIYRVSLATLSAIEDVVTTDIHDPRAIEVRGSGEAGDPVRVYWAEQGGDGVTRAIRSASAVTGDDVVTHVDVSDGVADFDDGEFVDLAIDSEGDDLYWVDATGTRIVGHSTVDGTSDERDISLVDYHAVELLEEAGQVLYSTTSILADYIGLVDEGELSSNDAEVDGVDDKIVSVATARTVVANAPSPPVATVFAEHDADEGKGAAVTVLAASGDGVDSADLTWNVVTAPSFGRFELSGSEVTRFTQADVGAGLVVYRHDGTENHADVAELEVDDGTSRSGPVTLTIDVTPANDAPTEVTLGASTVAENAVGAVIGRLTASDPDAGDTANYAVIGDARFTVDGDELKLAVGQSLDFETTPGGTIDVEVEASDADGATLGATLTITVEDINEPPEVVGTLAVQPASTGQPFVLLLSTAPWSDPDAGDELTLAVREEGGGALPAWLSFDPSSGQLTGTPPDAALGELRLEVVASDRDGLSAPPLGLVIDVVDGNRAPTGISLDVATVAENAPGAPIGRLTTSDPDAGDTVSYTVIGDTRFTVDGAGDLQLAAGESLDFEAVPGGTIDVEVVATDAGGASRRGTFTLTVTDENEAPEVAGTLTPQPASTGQSFILALSTASWRDPDSGDAVTLSVRAEGGDALPAWLSFDPSGNELTGTPPAAALGELRLEVVASDEEGLSSPPLGLVIDVVDGNRAPTGISLDVATVAENAPGATIGRLTTSDPDVGDSASYSVSDERFEIVGDELKLVEGRSLDHEETPSVEVEVVVTDSGGASYRSNLSLAVGDANDAPVTAIAPPTVTLGPGESYALPPDAFSDQDGDALTVTAASLPDWASFDALERRFVASGDGEEPAEPASATVRLVATDGRGGAAELDVTLRYEPDEEEPPALPPLARADRFELREGDTLVIDEETRSLLANDTGDAALTPLSAVLVDGPAHGTLALADDGTFRYEHDGGEQLVDTFSYRVSDGSGARSAPVEVTLVIEPLNDVPVTVREIGPQSVREGEPFVLVVDASAWRDADAGDSVSVSVGRADGGALPAWLVYDAQSGVLAGTPGFDDAGTVDLRFVARDRTGAAAAPLDVRLDVVNVNVAPDELVLTSDGVEENAPGAFVGRLSASDLDSADVPSFTTDDARFTVSGDALSLSAGTALDFETSAVIAVEITATDLNGATITRTFDVRVLDANDAPVATALEPPAELDVERPYTVPDGAFVDVDGDTLSYAATRVDGTALPGWLTFDADARTFAVAAAAETIDAELTAEVRLAVEDGRGGIAFADITFRRAPAPEPAEPAPALPEPSVPEPSVPEPTETVPEPIAPLAVPPLAPPAAAKPSPDSSTAGETETSTDGAQLEPSNEPTAPAPVDYLENEIIDLQALLADNRRESGALELIEVSTTIAPDLAGNADRFDENAIDTLDLGALLDGAERLTRRTFGDLADALDTERDEVDERAALARTLVGSSAGITSGLSVGYLLWLVRGGTLMGSVLSSLPAWRFVDPLPVLGTLADGIDDDDDDESLETLVAGRAEPRT